ncbi:MAG: MmcQ/YjbR family DNA-binding protein [Fimbriimonadaceae bacterium]|nr:MmcQ/YjbR family DNA-binding protein [Fimbriimonadaceae bacterium]
MDPSEALAKARASCLAHERAYEKLSHGSPCFFIEKGRQFAAFLDDHHGDGRLALWLPAAPGVQEALIQEDPAVYFRPPYVGPSGWIGRRLDRGLPWDTVDDLIAEAYELMAAKSRTNRRPKA